MCRGDYTEAEEGNFFVHVSLGNIGCVLEGMIMLGRVDHNIRKVVSKTVFVIVAIVGKMLEPKKVLS